MPREPYAIFSLLAIQNENTFCVERQPFSAVCDKRQGHSSYYRGKGSRCLPPPSSLEIRALGYNPGMTIVATVRYWNKEKEAEIIHNGYRAGDPAVVTCRIQWLWLIQFHPIALNYMILPVLLAARLSWFLLVVQIWCSSFPMTLWFNKASLYFVYFDFTALSRHIWGAINCTYLKYTNFEICILQWNQNNWHNKHIHHH